MDDEIKGVAKRVQERLLNDAMGELFGVGIRDTLDPQIGKDFQGHGIVGDPHSALKNLDNLLTGGIDQNRTFFTEQLSGVPNGVSLLRDHAHFVAVGGKGEQQVKSIKYVLVDQAMTPEIPHLQKRYPNVEFIPHGQYEQRLSQLSMSTSSPQGNNSRGNETELFSEIEEMDSGANELFGDLEEMEQAASPQQPGAKRKSGTSGAIKKLQKKLNDVISRIAEANKGARAGSQELTAGGPLAAAMTQLAAKMQGIEAIVSNLQQQTSTPASSPAASGEATAPSSVVQGGQSSSTTPKDWSSWTGFADRLEMMEQLMIRGGLGQSTPGTMVSGGVGQSTPSGNFGADRSNAGIEGMVGGRVSILGVGWRDALAITKHKNPDWINLPRADREATVLEEFGRLQNDIAGMKPWEGKLHALGQSGADPRTLAAARYHQERIEQRNAGEQYQDAQGDLFRAGLDAFTHVTGIPTFKRIHQLWTSFKGPLAKRREAKETMDRPLSPMPELAGGGLTKEGSDGAQFALPETPTRGGETPKGISSLLSGGGSGGVGGGDITGQLLQAIRELTNAIKGQSSVSGGSPKTPGPQPDGSFVAGGPDTLLGRRRRDSDAMPETDGGRNAMPSIRDNPAASPGAEVVTRNILAGWR